MVLYVFTFYTEPCINLLDARFIWCKHSPTALGEVRLIKRSHARFMQPRAWFAGDVNTIMSKQGSEPAASASVQHKPVLVWVMPVLMETFPPPSTMRRIHVIMYQADCKSFALHEIDMLRVFAWCRVTLSHCCGAGIVWRVITQRFKFKTTTALGFRLAAEQEVLSQLIRLSFWNFARVMWRIARLENLLF